MKQWERFSLFSTDFPLLSRKHGRRNMAADVAPNALMIGCGITLDRAKNQMRLLFGEAHVDGTAWLKIRLFHNQTVGIACL